MIDLERVTARGYAKVGSAVPMLGPVTLSLAGGVHVLVGAPSDGVFVMLALLGGRARLRSGSVRVLGGAPFDLGTRRAVAYVPLDVTLPDALRVSEALEVSASLRHGPDKPPSVRLATLGIESLADRVVKTLAPDEARAVALAEAITSPARVILVEEPYLSMDPRAAVLLADALRARAHAGACVAIGTASVKDATSLGDELFIFDRGLLVRRTSPSRVAKVGQVELRIASSDARKLVAALAHEEAVIGIDTHGADVAVTGRDLLSLAKAVNHAIVAANVSVTALEPEVPPLDELKTSAASALDVPTPSLLPPPVPTEPTL